MLLDAKSNLAKLMATENLIVEQKKASTAYFNLETRTLVIPILKKDLSADLYDLFIGHEVGHALNTPHEGWHDSVVDCGVNRSILNVVEDARIEKLIRRKYPGLRTSFFKAYKELMDLDFFGLRENEIDIKTCNLIDRINLLYKVGVSTGVTFTPEEQVLVDEVGQTETWEEVVLVAKKIQEFMKQQRKEELTQSSNSKTKEEIDHEPEEGEQSASEESEEFGESDTEPSYGQTERKLDEEEEIESETDNAFRKNEQDLYDNSNMDLRYANIPVLDAKPFIIEYKDLYKLIREKSESFVDEIDTSLYSKFRQSTTKVVSYLAKEFEMRKNADQLKRASIAKTGDLNMNKIYSYQFAEDIFKKMTVVPNGKSHGLVMFLDWSASMRDYMDDTIKQLLTLVLFCKSVNIPFEVYAFSSQFKNTSIWSISSQIKTTPYKDGDLVFESHVNLLNVLSSRMTKAELTYASNILLNKIYNRIDDLMLGNTPLNESIILAMDIIPKFQKANRLQNVNSVFLTDGEGHTLTNIKNEARNSLVTYPRLVLRDPITKVTIRADYKHGDTSKAFFHILKERTNCHVVGFRILRNSHMHRYVESVVIPSKWEGIKSQFNKEKSAVVTDVGYDELYLLKSNALSTEDEDLEVKSTTTRGLVSAFKKYTKNNITNRVVLNRFIELIS